MILIDRIKHFFGYHKYFYLRRLSEQSHLIKCQMCEKKFCMNTGVKTLIPLDQELRDFYYRMYGYDNL